MFKKTNLIATTLCLMAFNAPSFAQNTDTSGQNTASGVSGTTRSDPSMNSNTGTTGASVNRESDTVRGNTTGMSASDTNTANTAGTTTSGSNATGSGSMNTTTGSGTAGTMGTTTDTSAARTDDTTLSRDSAMSTADRSDSTYVQREESTGRSPFFYILLALIAFALIGYAVKASKRNDVHHTGGRV